MPRTWFTRRKRIFPLKWEITLALIIKVMLLYVLWALFFDQPMPREDRGENTSRIILNKP
ncbi:MAG: hypothetical protein RBS75_07965 [Methylophilaceae bacterium]|jgi:hypothetical protein|nr:hypothetical protein [Methylophilaceae bacterium]